MIAVASDNLIDVWENELTLDVLVVEAVLPPKLLLRSVIVHQLDPFIQFFKYLSDAHAWSCNVNDVILGFLVQFCCDDLLIPLIFIKLNESPSLDHIFVLFA